MAQYIALNKEAEVIGQTIMSVVKGMPGYESKAYAILEKNGIINLQEERWYSQSAWLKAFKEIAETIGANTLKAIGLKVIESAIWPSNIDSIETALASIDIAYHMNHRIKGEVLFNPSTNIMLEGIGHYTFEKITETEFKITCNNPYPCDFDKGILKGVVEKFKKPASKIEFKENVKTGCRNNGDHICTYHILIR